MAEGDIKVLRENAGGTFDEINLWTYVNAISVANQADNRLLTATGTANALNAEENLTFDGTKLDINGWQGILNYHNNAAATNRYGLNITNYSMSSDGAVNDFLGIGSNVSKNGSSNINYFSGLYTSFGFTDASSGTVDYAIVNWISMGMATGSTVTVNNMRGIYISNYKGTTGTITVAAGVYIDDIAMGATNYGLYSAISAGTNKWNLYISGTAPNYFAGDVQTNTIFKLPATSSTAGQIQFDSVTMFHTFTPVGCSYPNIFIGKNSGNYTMTGTTGMNVGIGEGTLQAMTTGYKNFALGAYTMYYNTTGFQNIAIGAETLEAGTGVSSNTAIGSGALRFMTTGQTNVAIGSSAFGNPTTVQYSIAIGDGAGSYKSTFAPYYCVLIGPSAGYLLDGYTDNVIAIGYCAMQLASSSNSKTVAIGAYAGYTGGGGSNVFIGNNAGYYETAGNKLMIDNVSRASEADARTKALVYGIFASTTANQYLTFNSNVSVTEKIYRKIYNFTPTGSGDVWVKFGTSGFNAGGQAMHIFIGRDINATGGVFGGPSAEIVALNSESHSPITGYATVDYFYRGNTGAELKKCVIEGLGNSTGNAFFVQMKAGVEYKIFIYSDSCPVDDATTSDPTYGTYAYTLIPGKNVWGDVYFTGAVYHGDFGVNGQGRTWFASGNTRGYINHMYDYSDYYEYFSLSHNCYRDTSQGTEFTRYTTGGTADIAMVATPGFDSYIMFSTGSNGNNPTERMRITSGGTITFGTSTTSYTFPSTKGSNGQSLRIPAAGGTMEWFTPSSGVSCANQADNRIITATSTTDALNAEAYLTYDGSILDIKGSSRPSIIINSVTTSGYLSWYHSNGTYASPTATADGDAIGTILFYGYGSGHVLNTIKIETYSEDAYSDSAYGSSFKILTVAEGAATLTERFTISKAGNIIFNNAYTFPTSAGSNGQALRIPAGGGTMEWYTPGTGTSNVSVANQSDNRIITATGTSDALNAEANLVFTGSRLGVNISSPNSSADIIGSLGTKAIEVGTCTLGDSLFYFTRSTSQTYTLPTDCQYRTYIIGYTGSSGSLSITPGLDQTINGVSAGISLSAGQVYILNLYDGTDWLAWRIT